MWQEASAHLIGTGPEDRFPERKRLVLTGPQNFSLQLTVRFNCPQAA